MTVPTIARSAKKLAVAADGAAILEFALVLPLLLGLAFGTFEVARALAVHRTMGEAARAGARALARLPIPACRPACPADVEAVRREVSDAIERTGVAGRAVSVAILDRTAGGFVAVEAAVGIPAGYGAWVGLDRLLMLRVRRTEAWLGPR